MTKEQVAIAVEFLSHQPEARRLAECQCSVCEGTMLAEAGYYREVSEEFVVCHSAMCPSCFIALNPQQFPDGPYSYVAVLGGFVRLDSVQAKEVKDD